MKPNTNPTFNVFVTEMNRDVFDGLVVGGTKEMKVRLQMAISAATWYAQNGGFAKEVQ